MENKTVKATDPRSLSDSARRLMESHRRLVHPRARENDSHSLAQPSPLRYVPSITTDHTITQPEKIED
jgi:hypothetical protein